MPHFAHTFGADDQNWEPLEDHLRRVADGGEESLIGAARFAATFGAEDWGRLAGWWHDLGKYSPAFQSYLRIAGGAVAEGDGHQAEVTGRVDHSTPGAIHALQLGQLGRVLAYVIAGHHAGLPDDVGSDASLSMRLKNPRNLETHKAACTAAPITFLDRPCPAPPKLRSAGNRQRGAFSIAFFTRMLFSCLVDADFLATEWFVDQSRSSQRPRDSATPAMLLKRLDAFLEEKRHTSTESTVNRRRQDVLAACREKAKLPPGLFSLNVPTGGGKTLSSLAFALTHATAHGLDRVVYAIPFTSIIEQTADVFRDALGEHAAEVLEHHSNLDPDNPKKQSERSRLAAENFDSPLVVTTNVQLFESLFACRTSRCRKLHRLAKSVIILDEAQALPPNLLAPTLAALDELARNYGTTVVLCTATQPAIEKRDGFPIGLEGVTPIIDDPHSLHGSLRRTHVDPAGLLTNDELAARLKAERQTLCIVNSRGHAAELCRMLGNDALHLSALMCAAHRTKVVTKIKRRLSEGLPCRVVATQVIEAGVDVDFPTVYRAAAGLDSIAQAAGRCNREGRLKDADGSPRLGRVVVFDYDLKAYRTVSMILRGASKFREVAPDHLADLLAPAAIEQYFKLHYWSEGGEGGIGWDKGKDGASIMDRFDWDNSTGLHAQFREAADRYRLIDDAQTPILVPYGKGRHLIRDLEAMPEPVDPKWLRGFDRRAQRYVVNVFEHALRKLLDNTVLHERHGRYYLANANAYDDRRGLTFETVGLDVESLIV